MINHLMASSIKQNKTYEGCAPKVKHLYYCPNMLGGDALVQIFVTFTIYNSHIENLEKFWHLTFKAYSMTFNLA